jgi:hypothetical protein
LEHAFDFDVAVSGRNSVTVAYEGFAAGGGAVVATRTLRPTGWTPPQIVSKWDAHRVVGDLDLGSNALGGQVVAWRPGGYLTVARRHGAAGPWSPANRLAAGAFSAAALVDASGRSYVVATAPRANGSIGAVFERGAAGPWSHERFARATAHHLITSVTAATNARGDLVVAWERTLKAGTVNCPCAAAARLRLSGAFEPTTALEEAGDARTQVTLDSRGVATLLWQRLTATRVAVRVARLDRAGLGPALFARSMPRPSPPCCAVPAALDAETNPNDAAMLLLSATRPALDEPGLAVVRCKAERACGTAHFIPDRGLDRATLAAEPRGAATVVWPDDCVYDPVLEECEYRTVHARRLTSQQPRGSALSRAWR